MADNKVSVIGTVANKLQKLPIRNGQVIFVKDKKKVALDLDGKRTFYNEIVTFDTDQERLDLLAPINGCFYFVITTAILWFYQDEWVQITTSPQEVIFFGTTLPDLGKENVLYVNKTSGTEGISVWDKNEGKYITVADRTYSMSSDDVLKLFN
ncbi:MAG TPA: hypothetical protein DCW90_05945 [Lachnospiraceae bacterium]|nr:hypothetical protein [Lachnospiraceae bacterium]